MDVHDQHTRSYNMSRIKGKNTKPEAGACHNAEQNLIRRICISIEYTIGHHTTNPEDLNVYRKHNDESNTTPAGVEYLLSKTIFYKHLMPPASVW